ncbi:hypothetical protein Micbo1qcDRAFT_157570 [Microdochium bolleyi]|uniref:Uncharacterized protein n=1 Tax=Microdochium bolleyi TaxID=196109 RepID=A0A136JEM2_9PEZI|nr:hypothetical protein Micbo1qcDRAFT_157570 [Microdochium bolleyi]
MTWIFLSGYWLAQCDHQQDISATNGSRKKKVNVVKLSRANEKFSRHSLRLVGREPAGLVRVALVVCPVRRSHAAWL